MAMTFAEQLTAARKAAGMTQEQLADAVHVARNTISTWEHNRSVPNIEMMRALGDVLHTDFLKEEDPLPQEESAEGPASVDGGMSPEQPAPEASGSPAGKSRKLVPVYAAAAALLLCGLLLVLFSLLNRPARSAPDDSGRRYFIADYDTTAPNDPEKAYLSIDKTLTVRHGDGGDFYLINFTLHEDNGVAFSIDRLELVIFSETKADPHVFSAEDLRVAGLEPDIPAYGFLSIDNGFPTDQNGLLGMSVKAIGTDANGESLIFTSYLPIP